MNLNFLKLKNSLLSLGLSATVSFSFGLAGFHASAVGPESLEDFKTAGQDLLTQRREAMKRGGPDPTIQLDTMSALTDLADAANTNGLGIPLRRCLGGYEIHVFALAQLLDVCDQTLYKVLTGAGLRFTSGCGRKQSALGRLSRYTLAAALGEPTAEPIPCAPRGIFDASSPAERDLEARYDKIRKRKKSGWHWIRPGHSPPLLEDVLAASKHALDLSEFKYVTMVIFNNGSTVTVHRHNLKSLTAICKSKLNSVLQQLGFGVARPINSEELGQALGRPVNPQNSRAWSAYDRVGATSAATADHESGDGVQLPPIDTLPFPFKFSNFGDPN
jgi:hypothetical protein